MCFTYISMAGFLLLLVIQIHSYADITNLKCTSLDEAYTEFEYCYIKSVNRSYKYFSVKANMHQLPITMIKVNMELFKKSNGYKPFLYNITVDACKFLSSKKRNPIVNFLYQMIEFRSNLNHTCPYDHDLIWDKISVNNIGLQFAQILPFPEGEYALLTSWFGGGVIRAEVRFHVTIS